MGGFSHEGTLALTYAVKPTTCARIIVWGKTPADLPFTSFSFSSIIDSQARLKYWGAGTLIVEEMGNILWLAWVDSLGNKAWIQRTKSRCQETKGRECSHDF